MRDGSCMRGSYKGTSTETGERVALKVSPASDLQNLKNELAMQRLCNHPNLVGLRDCFLWNNQLWIAMELMDAGCLTEILGQDIDFKEKYIAKYGDPEQKIMEKEQELKYDTEAEAYFADKAKDEIGFELKSEKIKEYSMNASVLNRLIERIQTQKLNRNKCGNSTPIAWDGIVAESERLRAQSGHTLPKSAARLQDKIRQICARAAGTASDCRTCHVKNRPYPKEYRRFFTFPQPCGKIIL